jgi:hypothetical protein
MQKQEGSNSMAFLEAIQRISKILYNDLTTPKKCQINIIHYLIKQCVCNKEVCAKLCDMCTHNIPKNRRLQTETSCNDNLYDHMLVMVVTCLTNHNFGNF